MDTNDLLRQRALRLMKAGVTQKAIAAQMGLSEATFSRWINGSGKPVPVTALDGFQRFADELRSALEQESQRSSPHGAAGPPFRTTAYTGPPRTDGGPERRQHADDGHGPLGETRRSTDLGASQLVHKGRA